MGATAAVKPKEASSLGMQLRHHREKLGMTLRDVQEATGKQISNAYLSQVENGRIQKPSPNILYLLAELYGVNYSEFMELAGYITPQSEREPGKHGKAATRAINDLTPEEENELLEYLSFMRAKNKRKR